MIFRWGTPGQHLSKGAGGNKTKFSAADLQRGSGCATIFAHSANTILAIDPEFADRLLLSAQAAGDCSLTPHESRHMFGTGSHDTSQQLVLRALQHLDRELGEAGALAGALCANSWGSSQPVTSSADVVGGGITVTVQSAEGSYADAIPSVEAGVIDVRLNWLEPDGRVCAFVSKNVEEKALHSIGESSSTLPVFSLLFAALVRQQHRSGSRCPGSTAIAFTKHGKKPPCPLPGAIYNMNAYAHSLRLAFMALRDGNYPFAGFSSKEIPKPRPLVNMFKRMQEVGPPTLGRTARHSNSIEATVGVGGGQGAVEAVQSAVDCILHVSEKELTVAIAKSVAQPARASYDPYKSTRYH